MGSLISKCKRGAGRANVVLDAITLPPVPADSDMVRLSSEEVSEILRKEFGNTSYLAIYDRNYFAFKKRDVEAFLISSKIDAIKYQKERFDCDDFAAALRGEFLQWFSHGHDGKGEERGAAFGQITGDLRRASEPGKARGHAMNFFIGSDRKVYIIEPQTDSITQWKVDYASTATVWSLLV